MATGTFPPLTRHIVISKGEDDNLVYGWWYLDAPFSFIVGTADKSVTVRQLAAHISEEWPSVSIHIRELTELETRPTIDDDEDMRSYDEDKRTLRTLVRRLVKLETEAEITRRGIR